MKTFLLILALLFLTACKSDGEPKPPAPPAIVKVPVDRYIDLPAWTTRRLPEDAPKANTPEEATRLACSRLGTIRYANCRAALTEQLQVGKAADPDTCKKHLVAECEVK